MISGFNSKVIFDSGLASFICWACAFAFVWIQELSLTFTCGSWMLFGYLFISLVSTFALLRLVSLVIYVSLDSRTIIGFDL